MKRKEGKNDMEVHFNACIDYGESIAKDLLEDLELTEYDAELIHKFIKPFAVQISMASLKTKDMMDNESEAVTEGMLKMLTILTAASKYIDKHVESDEEDEEFSVVIKGKGDPDKQAKIVEFFEKLAEE